MCPLPNFRPNRPAGELNSTYFDLLISDDLVDDLLTWLADPKGTRDRWETNRWEILCSHCIADYGFDPARDGELVGAEKLGLQEKLSGRRPGSDLHPLRFATPDFWNFCRAKPTPKAGRPSSRRNESSSGHRTMKPKKPITRSPSLRSPHPRSPMPARAGGTGKSHPQRREWVWAKLNLSPLAHAVEHLAVLAEVTQTALTGATTADMVKAYTESGWQADAAVLDALAAVAQPPGPRSSAGRPSAHIYAPWLRDAAELFQERVEQQPLPSRDTPRLANVPAGTCVLFVDGLRFDVGQKLRAALEAKLGKVQRQSSICRSAVGHADRKAGRFSGRGQDYWVGSGRRVSPLRRFGR